MGQTLDFYQNKMTKKKKKVSFTASHYCQLLKALPGKNSSTKFVFPSGGTENVWFSLCHDQVNTQLLLTATGSCRTHVYLSKHCGAPLSRGKQENWLVLLKNCNLESPTVFSESKLPCRRQRWDVTITAEPSIGRNTQQPKNISSCHVTDTAGDFNCLLSFSSEQ